MPATISPPPAGCTSGRGRAEAGAPQTVPIFRKRSSFQVPRVGLRPSLLVVLLGLLVAGFVVLMLVDVPPKVRPIEVEIPRERFSR